MVATSAGVRRGDRDGSVTSTVTRVVVVGGGAAGLSAAVTANAAGAAVTLVTDGPLGGDCTWHGCVPSKSLLEAAAAGVPARQAVAHAEQVVQRLARGENEHALGGLGIDVRRARVRLSSAPPAERGGPPRPVLHLGDGSVLTPGRGAVLATGSRPRPPEDVLDGVALPVGTVLTTTEGWLTAVGEHLDRSGPVVVVGGGASGAELAQALARLRAGGEHGVTLLERAGDLLPSLPGAGQVVAASLRADGVRVVMGADPAALLAATTVRAVSPGASAPAALVLLTAGREPALDVLGQGCGVSTSAAGIVVDAAMRTTAPGVWAAGDVCGLRPSTHVAVATGRVAAASLLGLDAAFDVRWAPRVVYTDPEVAAVGTVPGGPGTRSVRVPLSRSDRAAAAAVPAGRVPTRGWVRGGFAQVWVQEHPTAGGGTLVGALVVAPHAGELIGEVALVGRLGLSVQEWVGGHDGIGSVSAQHAYPTWSSLWGAVGDRLLGDRTLGGRSGLSSSPRPPGGPHGPAAPPR